MLDLGGAETYDVDYILFGFLTVAALVRSSFILIAWGVILFVLKQNYVFLGVSRDDVLQGLTVDVIIHCIYDVSK